MLDRRVEFTHPLLRSVVYQRAPADFKHPYGFDQPLESWVELVVANGFFDRAGFTLQVAAPSGLRRPAGRI